MELNIVVHTYLYLQVSKYHIRENNSRLKNTYMYKGLDIPIWWESTSSSSIL